MRAVNNAVEDLRRQDVRMLSRGGSHEKADDVVVVVVAAATQKSENRRFNKRERLAPVIAREIAIVVYDTCRC